MPVSKKWDTAAELDLCMAVIITGGSSPSYKWPEIHAVMCQLGHTFTKDAVSQHFTKTILRGFRARHGLGTAKSADTVPVARKRKAVKEEASPVKKQKPTVRHLNCA
ncbi:hypothetical protein EsDP_00003353 [Epichloe bromicola]|uniref:Uncharacterized protein n=1 Tax=Epichloe bromicola TaxID=79588 RepID=A0ABQ0CNH7_9HYPO